MMKLRFLMLSIFLLPIAFGYASQESKAQSSSPSQLAFVLAPRAVEYGLDNPILFDLVVTNLSSNSISGEMEFTGLSLVAESPPAKVLNCLPPSYLATGNSRREAISKTPVQTPLPLGSSTVNPNYAISGYPYVYNSLFTITARSSIDIPAVTDLKCFYKIDLPGAYSVQASVAYFIGNSDEMEADTNVLPIVVTTLPNASPLPSPPPVSPSPSLAPIARSYVSELQSVDVVIQDYYLVNGQDDLTPANSSSIASNQIWKAVRINTVAGLTPQCLAWIELCDTAGQFGTCAKSNSERYWITESQVTSSICRE